jgi:hypothetical protein
MTPGEVQGLQSLAMSQGGSLTINPQTGLPEAGILSSLLPMVAGFFLGPAGLGLTAMQSAVAVGALGTAATGSLGKGFMMGLGAYGGAGLGAGLTSAGAASNTAANTTTAGANTGAAATNNLSSSYSGLDKIAPTTTTATNAGTGTITATGGFEPYRVQGISQGPFAKTSINASDFNPNAYSSLDVAGPNLNLSGPSAGMKNVGYDMYGGFTQAPPPVDPISTGAPTRLGYGQTVTPQAAAPVVKPSVSPTTVTSAPAATTTPSKFGRFDDVGRGLEKATGSWEGAKEVWNATPTGTGYGLAATGISALQAQQEEAAEKARAAAAAKGSGYIRPYEFSTEQDPNAYANTSTAESRYFIEPRFVAKDIYKVKDGGLMSLAVGGQVEEMSAANAMGANTGYPMANLQTPMYANPQMARPVPTNVISPSGDTGVNTYSGEMRMAFGGSTGGLGSPSGGGYTGVGSTSGGGYTGVGSSNYTGAPGFLSGSSKSPKTFSEAKYSYDPTTMQYTKMAASSPSASNTRGGFGGLIPQLLQQMNQSQQPTVGSTSGGIAAPYMPPSGLAAADTSMIPNIQMQPQQNVDQQLGLQAFYPMMEQQLAMKGSNLQAQGYAEGGTANGGYSLGSYSDGGRLLRGPGDGVSDSIPASIGDRQPARLADGEFVVPARIVSEIGNGSTEAGARKLYAMMDRVQKARRKTVGKDKVAVNTKADKLLPA